MTATTPSGINPEELADLRREASARGTVCTCGLAKTYHGEPDSLAHRDGHCAAYTPLHCDSIRVSKSTILSLISEATDRAAELEGLRRRIHTLERHNQHFERCESGWCHPTPDTNPALGIIGGHVLKKKAKAAKVPAEPSQPLMAALDFLLSNGGPPGSRFVVAHNATCHAGKDGECNWKHCPQLRDNEPHATGRHCPIDNYDPDLED